MRISSSLIRHTIRCLRGGTDDGTLFLVLPFAIIQCAKLIIQAGIKRVVYSEHYRLEDGIELLKRAGVEVIYTELDETAPNK